MEKYKKFSYEKTGKVPYLPLSNDSSVLELIISVFIFPIRFFSILSLLLFWTLMRGTILEKYICHILVLVWGVELQYPKDVINAVEIESYIVLSNFSSLIDPFILKALLGSQKLNMIVKDNSLDGIIFARCSGAVEELSHALNPAKSLPSYSSNAAPISLEVDDKVHIFFEGARTNNTVALSADNLAFPLLKLIRSSGRGLLCVSISHSKKQRANPNRAGWKDFLTQLLTLSSVANISVSVLDAKEVKVTDSIQICLKKTFNDNAVSIIEKNHNSYKEFLQFIKLLN